jgi:hypothetical protein
MRSSAMTLLVVVALLYFPAAWTAAFSQRAVVLVGPTQQIKAGYKTYSLFLICNPGWLHPASGKSETQWLYDSFLNFGGAIGDDNLAVWFWRSPEKKKSFLPQAENVDVERSARFCKAWSLTPSQGPHLVITSTYPDEKHLSSGLPEKSAVFELGNMADSEIANLLSKLTDQLLLSGKVDKEKATGSSSASPAADSSPFWVGLLSAVQHTINTFGCAWTFKIDAGAVKADLHSCSTRPG